jgi:hypothetical protein
MTQLNTQITSERFNSWLTKLPVILAVSYVYGFIIVNSYLESIGLTDPEFFNIAYLTSGVLFSILYGSIILLLIQTVKHPTDNLKLVWPELFDFFVYLSFYLAAMLEGLFQARNINIWYFAGYFVFILIGSSRLGSRVFPPWLIKLFVILPAFGYQIYVYNTDSAAYHNFIVSAWVVALIANMAYGIYNDQKFKLPIILVALLASLALAAAFGQIIYDQIPNRFGGAKRDKIMLIIPADKTDQFKSIGFRMKRNNLTEPYALLHSSADHYWFHLDTANVLISRGEVLGFMNVYSKPNTEMQTMTDSSSTNKIAK